LFAGAGEHAVEVGGDRRDLVRGEEIRDDHHAVAAPGLEVGGGMARVGHAATFIRPAGAFAARKHAALDLAGRGD
jgi:hypothetical protein